MKKEIQNHTRNTSSIARQNGYSGLAISRPARMAHVNTMVVYWYFGSFDKLIIGELVAVRR